MVINKSIKKTEFLVFDLDNSVTREEITEVIANLSGNRHGRIKIGYIKTTRNSRTYGYGRQRTNGQKKNRMVVGENTRYISLNPLFFNQKNTFFFLGSKNKIQSTCPR